MQRHSLKITAAAMVFAAFFTSAALAGGAKPAKKAKSPPPPAAKVEDIRIGGVWTRAAGKGEKTHVFLTIENKGDVPARLRGGSTDIAKYTQLVQFKMLGAYLRTTMVGPVAVEPDEKYTFEPGVVGLELRELRKDLHRGDVLPVTLQFAGGVEIEVKAEVDSRSAVRYPPPGELPPAKAKAH